MCIWMPDSKRLISEAPISELDRRNMEAAAKRWMKKKHPSFDGDVYVENVRCFLEFPEEEREKYECTVNGEKTTALIFSRKHLSGLYLQCLIYRKEAMQHMEQLEGLSEVWQSDLPIGRRGCTVSVYAV